MSIKIWLRRVFMAVRILTVTQITAVEVMEIYKLLKLTN